MAAIISRWEWRVFSSESGAAERALAALTPGPAEESDELYSEDPSAVMTAVHGVGLDGHTNTSYPRGLAALVTGPSPYAVIDVGTNSVKFHVGERHPDGNWRAIADRAEVTRLGENLEHVGAISAEPLDLARLDGRPRPDALVAMAVR